MPATEPRPLAISDDQLIYIQNLIQTKKTSTMRRILRQKNLSLAQPSLGASLPQGRDG
jgi:hypothetical protein